MSWRIRRYCSLYNISVLHRNDAIRSLSHFQGMCHNHQRLPMFAVKETEQILTSLADSLSRFPVGSSAQTIAGSFVNARAMVTR